MLLSDCKMLPLVQVLLKTCSCQFTRSKNSTQHNRALQSVKSAVLASLKGKNAFPSAAVHCNDCQVLAQVGEYLKELLVDLLQKHFNASERAGSGNARPHEAAAQHRNLLNAPRLQAAIRDSPHLRSSESLAVIQYARILQSLMWSASQPGHVHV